MELQYQHNFRQGFSSMAERELITVLIADDHPMMRAGLKGEIDAQPDMRVVAEANDGKECIEMFKTFGPGVTLLDLRMPGMNGLDALKGIRAVKSDAKVIVLTTYLADVQVHRAFQAGATAYLLKSMLRNELAHTIRAVMSGHRRLSPEIAAELASYTGDEYLSERELLVLRAIAEGCSNRAIGVELGISEYTINNHVQNILTKLKANDRTHAVTIALKRGFIEVT